MCIRDRAHTVQMRIQNAFKMHGQRSALAFSMQPRACTLPAFAFEMRGDRLHLHLKCGAIAFAPDFGAPQTPPKHPQNNLKHRKHPQTNSTLLNLAQPYSTLLKLALKTPRNTWKHSKTPSNSAHFCTCTLQMQMHFFALALQMQPEACTLFAFALPMQPEACTCTSNAARSPHFKCK